MMNDKTITKLRYSVVGLALLLSGCEQAELMTYDHSANIYFELTDDDRDSITYTFAYDMTMAQDTVYIPTQLSGIREDRDRYFAAYVEQDSSSAVTGVHYEPLADQYLLPTEAGRAYLPVVINNTADLEENTVSLVVKLRATDDFGIENPNLIRAKIVFSARLEQPVWWSMWLGAYSRTKHQLFLLVTEQTSLTMDGLDAPKNLYFANMLTMMLNNPFGWVEDHLEKGYVLEPTTDGATTSYHFYHRDNPGRIILLRQNASGMYYFIDENGEEVR